MCLRFLILSLHKTILYEERISKWLFFSLMGAGSAAKNEYASSFWAFFWIVSSCFFSQKLGQAYQRMFPSEYVTHTGVQFAFLLSLDIIQIMSELVNILALGYNVSFWGLTLISSLYQNHIKLLLRYEIFCSLFCSSWLLDKGYLKHFIETMDVRMLCLGPYGKGWECDELDLRWFEGWYANTIPVSLCSKLKEIFWHWWGSFPSLFLI